MNLHDFTPLAAPSPSSSRPNCLVSVCIPARNEEINIGRAVHSVLAQKYESIEILVLDDQSTDETPHILSNLQNEHPQNLSVIQGQPKPAGWLGKSWACHQLSEKATGDILFFIDADVWLHPQALDRAVASLWQYNLDFLTVWPMQRCGTFWEKAVIPLIYYGLLALLPARYVYQTPSWLPSFLEEKMAPKFAAACGQCMVFNREAYQKIGGHQSVKNNIVEDVALAKQIKKRGFTMRMFHGKESVWCRMYRSNHSMWQGFRKNFLALFDDSIIKFLAMALLNLIVFVMPLATLIYGLCHANRLYIWLSSITLLIAVTHRIILAGWYQFNILMSFLHPLGVLWFELLGIRVLIDHLQGNRAKWKDRPIG